jgi:hypothetical protein
LISQPQCPLPWSPEWNAVLDAGSDERQRDAVEFLKSAVSKWALYEHKARVVRSFDELVSRVKRDEKGEVLGILTASAPWYRNGAVAGFCQFRRTWCNNVVFDFLGVNPKLLMQPTREISGLGTALLYRLALIARELKARLVWAETTDTSADYYAKLFALPSIADLLVVEAQLFFKPLNSAIEPFLKAM